MNKTPGDLQYLLIKSLLKMLTLIPRPWFARLAVPLGRLWYGLDPGHRKIAFDNMTIAFGREMDRDAIRDLVKANFVQLTRAALELPSLLRLNRKNLASYVTFEGLHHFEQARSRGAGVLFLTAHLGNWELMALAASLKLEPFYVMIRPLDSPAMDRLLTEIRSRTGNRMIDKDKSAALVSGLLRNNKTLGILLDQNSSWYEGVYVPFFGKVVCTNKGLAILAMRYGATVLPAFNIRQPDGRYRIIIGAPVPLVRSSHAGRDISENTARFNQIIEKYIRLAPDNWLWVHRRFRIKDIPEQARKRIKGI
ncbi:MAG: lysophospholipid acyltransferase family protein [Desulfobacterales bacterium]|nr:lysophospholipid acyltransferase family protein [Desulfobacterales bacterium]